MRRAKTATFAANPTGKAPNPPRKVAMPAMQEAASAKVWARKKIQAKATRRKVPAVARSPVGVKGLGAAPTLRPARTRNHLWTARKSPWRPPQMTKF